MADDADRIAALEKRVAQLEAVLLGKRPVTPSPAIAPMAQPLGCVCPPGTERTCGGMWCPRRNALGPFYARQTYNTGGANG